MENDIKQIGQIGLGLLGGAIAERLLHQGFEPKGFDLDSNRCAEFENAGGKACFDAREVFQASEVVILSLPTSETVSRLIEEQKELKPGQIVVDTTTGHPDEMEAIGRRLKEKGVDYLECNVAGSSRQMRTGEAVLFLGGDAGVVSLVQPILQALAPQHFHLGRVGAASRFKLVHNLILGLHRAVLAEGLSFASALGFTPQQTLNVLRQTPAASAVMDAKGEKMANRDWQPEAKLSQHLKDVRLILEMAEKADTPTPLSLAHRELLERAELLGFGDADNSAILEAFQPASG